MRILLTGASGFVGTPLSRALFLQGHELVVLTRDVPRAERRIGVKARYVEWEPQSGPAPAQALTDVDAVFNLMGENLGAGRWTPDRKAAIYDSRIIGTRNLIAGFGTQRPDLWVNFSAVGYYPVNEPVDFDEDGPAGSGFAARVCTDWEREAQQIEVARRVILRVGTVFGHDGGALAKLLPLFKAGLGGPVGAGRQMMSWIHRDDLVRLCLACLEDARYAGVINAVAPAPVSNAAFSAAFGRAVRRPAVLPAPPPALKLVYGEMAQLVLDGQRVVPGRLRTLGFEWHYGEIEAALREVAGTLPVGLNGEVHVCDRYEDFCFIERPVDEVFPFFADPGNLAKITPPRLDFAVESVSTAAVEEGTVIEHRLRFHGVPIQWRTLIREWRPGERFVDFQLRGPYRIWNHTHRFTAIAGGTAMYDRVDYQLPLGPLGNVAQPLIASDLRRIFDYRREAIRSQLAGG